MTLATLDPPPAPTLDELARASLRPRCTLDELAALVVPLRGAELPLVGLRALVSEEPALGPELAERVLPAVLRHAAAYPRGAPLARLLSGESRHFFLTREQAASIVATMFLGLLPEPASPEHKRRVPYASFDSLHARAQPQELAKLRCVLEYFRRRSDPAIPATGSLRIARVALDDPRDAAAWGADASPLGALVEVPEGRIEDARDAVHVDFANRYLGGGALSGGCVQEEIRFAECPELFAAMPLCEVLGPGEALRIDGSEFYARTRGYARSLRYGGPCDDPSPRDEAGAPRTAIVAIDAVDYGGFSDRSAQLDGPMLLRDLEKARAGFRLAGRGATVATGHWGCGAFAGHHPLKLVQQWLAASSEGVELRYFTFGDARAGDVGAFVSRARERFRTAGPLCAALFSVAREARAQRRPFEGARLLDALLGS